MITRIMNGQSNKEIACDLNLSPHTVKSRVHTILERLSVHNRLQIAHYANYSAEFQRLVNTMTLIDK